MTNQFGIDWLQRHLGDEYKIHNLTFENNAAAMHIDATVGLIKPGLVMLNPDRQLHQKELFEKAGWKVL